jgi:hypothetical protein
MCRHVRALTLFGCLVALAARRPCPVAAGTVYYVAVGGADQHAGSAAQPWRTISHAATQVRPGDLVVVQPGTYSDAVWLDRSGEEGAPIVFRGLPGAVMSSPAPMKSLSAFDVSGDVSNIVVEGFDLGGGFAETVFVRPGAHHIVLAGLHIHHNRAGIWIGGATDVVVRDSVIDHNHRTGVRVFGGARRVRVVDTRSEANDDGLGCGGDSDGFNADDTTADIAFERVAAIANSEDGLDLQAANASVLRADVRNNGCSGVKIAAGGYLENLIVADNRTGINVSGASDAVTVIDNCTLSQNDLGVRALGADYELLLRNSIISGPAKALNYAAGVRLIEHHNIFHRPLPKDRLIVRADADSETLFSSDDVNDGVWQRASGQGEQTVARDPRLEPRSCVPLADSAAVDSGDGTAVAPQDLFGTPRPVGDAVDRGAVERLPQAPSLRLRRLALHATCNGTGEIRLSAEMTLPPGSGFNPRTDALRVALRGSRGEVLRTEVMPADWTWSTGNAGTLVALTRTPDASRPRQVRLYRASSRVRVWLSAQDADTWTIAGTQITVSVELGHVLGSGRATLRSISQFSPACFRKQTSRYPRAE